jgi:predicted ATP-dependent protease
MSQHGEVQPIGGVNEKVEGFFRVCAIEGLTGTQGVVIPVQNVADLNLASDVVDAIEAGEFHIYPVERVEEALAIFLGCDASAGEGSDFPADSVHAKVAARLDEMAESASPTTE